jgi:hypothetical protein
MHYPLKLNEELIADSFLDVPSGLCSKMVGISSSISSYYMELDALKLPASYIEEKNPTEFPGFIEI